MAQDNEIDVRVTAQTQDIEAGMAKASAAVSTASVAMGSGMTEAAAASTAAANSFKQLGNEAETSGRKIKLGATGMREVIVLAHEMATGNFSRIPGSIMVLGERTSGLDMIMHKLSGTMGVVALAGTALVGVLGYIAYKAIESEKAITGIQGALLATGRLGETSTEGIRKWITQLQDDYHITQSEAEKVATAFAHVTTLAIDQKEALSGVSVTLAHLGFSEADVAKEAARLADAAMHGSKGLIEFARTIGADATEAEKLAKAFKELEAKSSALKTITNWAEEHGGAWDKAKAKFLSYMEAIASTSVEGGVPNWNAFGPAPPMPSRRPTGGPGTQDDSSIAGGMRGWMRGRGYSESAIAGILGNAQIESSFDPWASGPGNHKYLFGWDETRQKRLKGTNLEDQLELMDKEISERRPGFKTSTAPAGQLAKEFEDFFEVSGGQKLNERVAAANKFSGAGEPTKDPQVVDAERQKALRDSEAGYKLSEIAHRHSLEQQVADAQKHYDDIAKISGKGTAEEVRAFEELTRAKARLYDEDTTKQVGALREKENFSRSPQEKVGIQEQTIGALSARGMGDTSEYRAAVNRLAILKREAVDQELREGIKGASEQQRVDSSYMESFERNQRIMVDRRQETLLQSIGFDIQYSSQLYAQERERLEHLMSDNRREESEKRELYMRLLELDAQHQAKIDEYAKKYADEVKRETDKFAQPFKQAFDSIGSSAESTLTGLLDGTKTWGQATLDIVKSVESGFIKMATSIASKAAAGPLAKLLGTTANPGEGVGDVLGNAASSWAGKQISGLLPNVGDVAGKAAETATVTAAITAASAAEVAATTAGSAAIVTALGTVAGLEAANFAKPSVLGTTFTYGGIASAAGGWTLPKRPGPIPANLHGGEMVLPAHISDWVQKAAGEGGAGGSAFNLHFHGPADAHSIDRWFNKLAESNISSLRDKLSRAMPRP